MADMAMLLEEVWAENVFGTFFICTACSNSATFIDFCFLPCYWLILFSTQCSYFNDKYTNINVLFLPHINSFLFMSFILYKVIYIWWFILNIWSWLQLRPFSLQLMLNIKVRFSRSYFGWIVFRAGFKYGLMLELSGSASSPKSGMVSWTERN